MAGKSVQRFTLANANGMRVDVLNFGGVIASVEFPDRNGDLANIVLGFKSLQEYVDYNAAPTARNPHGLGPYFGAIIGRVANRIPGGRFELGGATYQVPTNQGGNALHGGDVGFDQRVWDATRQEAPGEVGVRLLYVSPSGEMGFPGTLTTVATYTLDDQDRLALRIQATTDVLTVVNVTNHTYWNLAGEASGSTYDHVLQIHADSYTPVGEGLIPTGEIAPVAGTPLDFRAPHRIGERTAADHPQIAKGHGYDHNWVLNQTNPRSLVLAATATEPISGRRLDVFTTQPGCQVYTGNYLNGTVIGTSGHAYERGDGLAIETQHFPGSTNRPEFPSIALRPGKVYEETIVYKLSLQG